VILASNADLNQLVAEQSPPGSVLSHQRSHDPPAHAARTIERHPAIGRPFPPHIQAGKRPRNPRLHEAAMGFAPALPMAGNVRELGTPSSAPSSCAGARTSMPMIFQNPSPANPCACTAAVESTELTLTPMPLEQALEAPEKAHHRSRLQTQRLERQATASGAGYQPHHALQENAEIWLDVGEESMAG